MDRFLRRGPAPPPLAAPSGLRLEAGDAVGQFKAVWDVVQGATAYKVGVTLNMGWWKLPERGGVAM